MKHTIEVTQFHIDNGTKCNARRCPVTLALKDKFTEYEYIWVDIDSITISNIDYFEKSPDEVSSFVEDFDGGEEVKPFSFTIELPE